MMPTPTTSGHQGSGRPPPGGENGEGDSPDRLSWRPETRGSLLASPRAVYYKPSKTYGYPRIAEIPQGRWGDPLARTSAPEPQPPKPWLPFSTGPWTEPSPFLLRGSASVFAEDASRALSSAPPIRSWRNLMYLATFGKSVADEMPTPWSVLESAAL